MFCESPTSKEQLAITVPGACAVLAIAAGSDPGPGCIGRATGLTGYLRLGRRCHVRTAFWLVAGGFFLLLFCVVGSVAAVWAFTIALSGGSRRSL